MKSGLLRLFSVVFAVTGMFQGGSLTAQDNLRAELFGEVNQLFSQVKEKHGDLYAPISYEKAQEYYRQATDDYTKGRSLEDIRDKIKNARAYFAKALDACKSGETVFAATMSARTDAASAGAQRSSPELWSKGEQQFNKAARSLEEGRAEDARRSGTEAEATYRAAELEAIKTNYLAPARDLLKQADDQGVRDIAPKTLAKAQTLASRVEEILKQNRYDTDEARQLAREAKYEAAHAIYLTKAIREMKSQDKTVEDLMLANEAEFQKVSGALGLLSRFDNGYNPPVAEAIGAIRYRDLAAAHAADSVREIGGVLRQKEVAIDNLREQVSSYERRLGSLTEAEQKLKETGNELQRKLTLQRQQEETVRQVAAMFNESEGNLLRDADNIVLRLYGLSFPVGRNTIESQYYPLLTKVQEAIKKFSNCRVTIEGHTDSQGSDEQNQALSELRAKAVAEYLMANMGVEIPVSSHGFGESRPVASNDTPDGRAKNRRIDVVITPGWAATAR